MLEKTALLVLGSVKYGDNSIILHTYSREHGRLGLIAGGLHSKKGPLRPAMVQPLSLLEVVYLRSHRSDLMRLREAQTSPGLTEIPYHPVKSGLALFLAELFARSIHEQEPNYALYHFLENTVLNLDRTKEALGSFHLKTLYNLPAYLGFRPEEPGGDRAYFDLLNGNYSQTLPPHPHFLEGAVQEAWIKLHRHSQSLEVKIPLAPGMRAALLSALLDYFRLHINDFGELRSLPVLREMFS